MPELDDFFPDPDDDVDDIAAPVLPPNPTLKQVKAWLAQFDEMTDDVMKRYDDMRKSLRANLAEVEPIVAGWYSEVEALSAKRWRTVRELQRLDELLERIENQPILISRMGPPPWPKDVVDTNLA